MNTEFARHNTQKYSRRRKSFDIPLSSLIKLILVLMIIISRISLNAQDVVELDVFLARNNASHDPAIDANTKHLESLLKEVQPTIFVSANEITSSGANPLCVEVEASAINQLYLGNSLFSRVEVMIIRLKDPADLNFKLDLTKLSGFLSLKYVYFLCEFECRSEEIQKLITPKAGITTLYKVSIPR
jgi:hypothetical protein